MHTKTERPTCSTKRKIQTAQARSIPAKLPPPFDDERVRKKAVQLVSRALTGSELQITAVGIKVAVANSSALGRNQLGRRK